MSEQSRTNRTSLWVAAAAAFSVYFCMYAFRKPFTAASYEGLQLFNNELKSILVISQLLGYMTSKFIGIKLVSEWNRNYRAFAIIGLIVFAELALVLFAFVPNEYKVIAMFLNGLPLGMVFGFVLSFLEGRTTTEALSAALCASFIMSSGVVKSIGQWLIQEKGVDEFHMPMVTGLIFLLPLLFSVWVLQKTPPPSELDIQSRNKRSTMDKGDRWKFFNTYWPGLLSLFAVYVTLTILRTFRDDFGVEIWKGLGVSDQPSIYASSESIVSISVTLLNAVAIFMRNNLRALRVTFIIMTMAFVILIGSTLVQDYGRISPLLYMVLCGIGLYIPYVAFHTTVFERIVSASNLRGNLVFLMYLADSIGYLGYVVLLSAKPLLESSTDKLGLFQNILYSLAGFSILCLLLATVYFQRKLSREKPGLPIET
ncbi:MAG: DUF5690 family protein [Planctomycetota bacterium]|nr:DUF5690 family protein [Planctomycetota bacterium]